MCAPDPGREGGVFPGCCKCEDGRLGQARVGGARYVLTSTLLSLHQARTRGRSRQTQWQTTTRGGVAATVRQCEPWPSAPTSVRRLVKPPIVKRSAAGAKVETLARGSTEGSKAEGRAWSVWGMMTKRSGCCRRRVAAEFGHFGPWSINRFAGSSPGRFEMVDKKSHWAAARTTRETGFHALRAVQICSRSLGLFVVRR